MVARWVQKTWVQKTSAAVAWSYAAAVVGFYALASWRSGAGGLSAEPSTLDTPIAPGDTLRELAHDALPTHDEGRWPFISVIVPARDEERNIRLCVESLLAQDYPHFEVIVVDDASSDATPQILADLRAHHPSGDRLRIVRVESLPHGWAGKPHALHTGVEQSHGAWLLFTDADTRHKPAALRTALEVAIRRHDDLLSFGTQQDLPDFWGRTLMPLAYMGISFQYPTRKVNDPQTSLAIANGQYILIRRAMYERVGGYASPQMRATVLDDRDLAQLVKDVGGRLELVDGHTLVSTRMYQSLSEHWNGWSKNAYAGSRGGPAFFLAMLVGLPLLSVLPFLLLVAGLVSRRPRLALLGAVPTSAALLYRTQLNRSIGVPWRYVWTHPLGGAVFTGILARSFWAALSGRGVAWKGRTYQRLADAPSSQPIVETSMR